MSDTEPYGADGLPIRFDEQVLPQWAPGQGRDVPDDGILVGTHGAEDRYRLIRRLGRGLEGEVWESEDRYQQPPKPCALKLVQPPTPSESRQQQRRWMEQREILLPLSHPSLVKVQDMFLAWRPHRSGQCSGFGPPPEQHQVYVAVMDLVRGPKLADIDGSVPIDERVGWVKQVADAVAYLHRQTRPVLHRDISPNNIIVPVRPSGGSSTLVHPGRDVPRAMLVDYGLVRIDEVDKSAVLAATRGYCAPEVWQDARETSKASDVYSLAASACFAFLGRAPSTFPPEELGQRLSRALGMSVQNGREVVGVLLAMLDPTPTARPPAYALLTAIEDRSETVPIDVPTVATASAAAVPSPPSPDRRRALIPFVLVGLVVFLLGALAVSILTRPDAKGPDSTPAVGAPSPSTTATAATIIPATTTTSFLGPSSIATSSTAAPISSGQGPVPQADIAQKLLSRPEVQTITGIDGTMSQERQDPLFDPSNGIICDGILVSGNLNSDGYASFQFGGSAGSEISGFRDASAAQSWMAMLRQAVDRCGFVTRTGPQLGDEVVRFGRKTDGYYTYDSVIIRKGPNIAQVALKIADGLHLTKADKMAAQLGARLP